jgi:hypothetical protein
MEKKEAEAVTLAIERQPNSENLLRRRWHRSRLQEIPYPGVT